MRGGAARQHPGRSILVGILGGSVCCNSAALAPAACPNEPLWSLHGGGYTRISRNGRRVGGETSCGTLANGSCPFAVPFWGLPCLVTCVASEQDCGEVNSCTPEVNRFSDAHLCRKCSIVACKTCNYDSTQAPTCKECFPGFTGISGPEGRWTACAIWDQHIVLLVGRVLCAIVALILLVISVATCVGVCKVRQHHHHHRHTHYDHDAASSSKPRESAALADPLLRKQTFDSELSEEEAKQGLRSNQDAIRKGLDFNLLSSIKFSSTRSLTEHARKHRPDGHPRPPAWSFLLSSQFDDLGIGLQLFFNTQIFLIIEGAFGWLLATVRDMQTQNGTLFLASASSDPCSQGSANVLSQAQLVSSDQASYAKTSICVALSLWVIAVLSSWLFYHTQRCFISRYDKRTLSAEDYTLLIERLPEQLTSERKLKEILETELGMQDRLYGVCICYNIKGGPGRERIEDMIERLVEWDDIRHGWYEDNLATPQETLESQIKQDKADLVSLLQNKQLLSSGFAYAVFKKQTDMLKVLAERRGICRSVFDAGMHAEATGDNGAELLIRVAVLERKTTGHARVGPLLGRLENLEASLGVKVEGRKASLGNRLKVLEGLLGTNRKPGSEAGVNKYNYKDVVIINSSADNPGGIRFMEMSVPPRQHHRNVWLWMPLRMLGYISAYAVLAQLFYSTMIKPWQDNYIEGAEDSAPVMLVGKVILLINFTIQTLVMMDVEKTAFVHVGMVDCVTFIYNTVLLLVTNAYIVIQECYQAGVEWVLVPGETLDNWKRLRPMVRSAKLETNIGERMVSVITEQILMLYIMGEVANVLLPLVFYHVSLRSVFVWNLGGNAAAWARRGLRTLLPRSQSLGRVTVREAEKAQTLVPLLLWMEYTYTLVFPFLAMITLYIVTDKTHRVFLLLFVFAVLFYIWQRYFMLWLYGKMAYDMQGSFQAFIRMWGIVLSMLPPTSVWWLWRLGGVKETSLAIFTGVLIYTLALIVYLCGLLIVDWFEGQDEEEADEVEDEGYQYVMEEHGISWWNANPIYVLKNRYCPELPGHEVHRRDVACWPSSQTSEGFFELGKEFRHRPCKEWELEHNQRTFVGLPFHQ